MTNPQLASAIAAATANAANSAAATSSAIPGGLSVAQLMEQMAEMQAQLNKLMGNAPAERGPREMKTYYHQIPGSNIVVVVKGPHGEHLPETFHFYGGQLETDIPEVQDFLDGILRSPGSPVSIKPAAGNPDMAEVAGKVRDLAAASLDKLGAEAGVKQ